MYENEEIINELEEKYLYLNKKIDVLDDNELDFEKNIIENLFIKIKELNLTQIELNKIDLLKNNINKLFDNKKIDLKNINEDIINQNDNIDNEKKDENKKDLNVDEDIHLDDENKEYNYFESINKTKYSIKFINKNYKAKFIEDKLILFNKKKNELIAIPYDNLIEYSSYSKGKFKRKIEILFLGLLFVGSLFYLSGFFQFIFVLLFGFLLFYPFFTNNFLFIKIKMDSEPENSKHYRPVISTYKIIYKEEEFYKEIQKRVKFYHSVLRLFG